MALNFEQQDQKVSEEPFVRRVAQAAVKTAVSIMAEASSTPGHSERAALAVRVEFDAVVIGRTIARGVVTNSNCGDGGADDPLVNDSALEFVVSSMWNAYAGYSAN